MPEEYLVSDGYDTHVNEVECYRTMDHLQCFIPVCYATLKGSAHDQNGDMRELDILIVEKTGPSVKWLLESGFTSSLEAGSSRVTAAVAVEINVIMLGLWDLTRGLSNLQIDWYSNFHIGSVCQKECGEGLLWVDVQRTTRSCKTYHQCMVLALGTLYNSSMLTDVPFPVKEYWNSLRSHLADFSMQENPCRATLCDCLKKCVPVLALPRRFPLLQPKDLRQHAENSLEGVVTQAEMWKRLSEVMFGVSCSIRVVSSTSSFTSAEAWLNGLI